MPDIILDNEDTAVNWHYWVQIPIFINTWHFIAEKTENKESKYKPNGMWDNVSAEEKKALLTQSKERNEAESLSIFFCTGPGPNVVYVPK